MWLTLGVLISLALPTAPHAWGITPEDGVIVSGTVVRRTTEIPIEGTCFLEFSFRDSGSDWNDLPLWSEQLDVDCVNIELRIWAYSVGSIELVTRFEAGESIHAMITLILYPSLASLSFDDLKKTKQYDQCKAGNFSRIYGAGDKKANATYGVHNACEIIDKHFPEISRFTKTCVQMAQASVETFFEPAIFTKKGYKVDVPQNKLYKAVNAYVQGTAGEIMGLMMIECFKKDYPMFQQVHDSLKFELDESQEHLIPEILATMRSAGETVIPSCHLDHKVIRHVSV
jgi:DNA polymerase I-like protein with 3'-5' exonuclease and polymerase domains